MIVPATPKREVRRAAVADARPAAATALMLTVDCRWEALTSRYTSTRKRGFQRVLGGFFKLSLKPRLRDPLAVVSVRVEV